MADVTIDELNIKVAADSNSAATALENLAQKLERLQAPIDALTRSNSGLDKFTKTLEKLSAAANAAKNLDNLDKISNAASALQSLNQLSGVADVSGYVKAIEKLARASSSVNEIAQFPDINSKVSSLITALKQFEGVNQINIAPLVNAIGKLPGLVSSINTMPDVDTGKIQELRTVLMSFQNVSDKGVTSFINAFNRLPAAITKLQNVDLGAFRRQIEGLINSLEPLTQMLQQNGVQLQAFATVLNSLRISNNVGRGADNLNTSLGNLRAGTLLTVQVLRRLVDVLADCFNVSAQYVENLNLFRVTMADSTNEAYAYAEAVNDALGIDVSDWIKYQGFFQSVAKGFGLTAQKADLMSKNLTQLSYDISSFYNLSVDTAYVKVQAGIAGELEPLRRLGFALDQATLKQVAFNHGITQAYEDMTQAQKSQLRYVAMIEQAQAIGVTGDMSRTIDSASNNMRVLTARIQQLARAVGNILLPILSEILPYLTAFVQIITEAAQSIAEFFGYQLPQFDFSGISTGYDDIADAADEATNATNKFKGSLAGVDQLNIIGSKSDKNGNGIDDTNWELDLPSYDFLNGVESRTKEIVQKIKGWIKELLPWIEAVGAAVAAIFIANKAKDFIDVVKKFPKAIEGISTVLGGNAGKTFFGIAGGLAAGATSGVLLFNSIKNLISKTGQLGNNIAQLVGGIGIAVGGIAAFIALGNPVGAVITGVIAGLGAIIGAIQGVNEEIEAQNKKITDSILYNNGGTKITDIANAFNDWADSATRVNQQTINKYNQLDNYNTKIGDVLDTLNELDGIKPDFTNIEPADAEKLIEPFNELCDYLENNLQDRTKLAAEDLTNIFANMGIGGVISKQFEDAYAEMQLLFNENLTESQKTVSGYLNKISGGEALTIDEQNSLAREYQYIMDKAALENEAYVDFTNSMKKFSELDLSNPDLIDEKTALAAFDDMKNSYSKYVESLKTLAEKELSNVATLKSNVELDYSYGKLDYSQYKEQMDLLDFTEQVAKINYNTNVDKISSAYDSVLTGVAGKLNDAAKQVAPNLWENIVAGATTGGIGFISGKQQELAETFAEAGFLNGSELYQGVLDGWDSMRETEIFTIDIDTSNIYSDVLGTIQQATNDASALPINLTAKATVDVDKDEFTKRIDEIVAGYQNANISGEGLNKSAVNEWSPTWRAPVTSPSGYARDTVNSGIDNVINFMRNDSETTFTIYNNIELDGESVGEAVNTYNTNQLYRSGGRGGSSGTY